MRSIKLPIVLGLMLFANIPGQCAVEATQTSAAAKPAAQATLTVGPLFSDNAVLQQKKPVMIWGTDKPFEPVFVTVLAPKATKPDKDGVAITKADKDGNWRVKLSPLKAGGPYVLTIKDAHKQYVAHNVSVGEVWLCAGQSNMSLPTSFSRDSKEDIAASKNPNLHLFTVKQNLSQEVCTEYEGAWQTAEPNVVRDYSAVAYYFGSKLQEQLKVPVGIIWASYQGTPIKVWMSTEAIENSHQSAEVILPPDFLAIRQQFEKDVAAWQEKVNDCRAKGLDEPAKPVLPSNFYAISSAFNAMINPLIPYSLRGVTWYQGESDTDQPGKYPKMFGCMIDDWRKRWNEPTLPFIYTQLPAYGQHATAPQESTWAELRDAQLMCRRIPYTYMISTIDVNRPNARETVFEGPMKAPDIDPSHGAFNFIDMHPREKKPVGNRLANAALSVVYKKPIPYSGPLYDSMTIEGNKARLTFRYAEDGLVAKDGPLKGFQISGQDKKWYLADAKIDGDSVVVSSDKVAAPIAVRYAWASYPFVNLYNEAGLPAAPFRTDRWMHHWNRKTLEISLRGG